MNRDCANEVKEILDSEIEKYMAVVRHLAFSKSYLTRKETDEFDSAYRAANALLNVRGILIRSANVSSS